MDQREIEDFQLILNATEAELKTIKEKYEKTLKKEASNKEQITITNCRHFNSATSSGSTVDNPISIDHDDSRNQNSSSNDSKCIHTEADNAEFESSRQTILHELRIQLGSDRLKRQISRIEKQKVDKLFHVLYKQQQNCIANYHRIENLLDKGSEENNFCPDVLIQETDALRESKKLQIQQQKASTADGTQLGTTQHQVDNQRVHCIIDLVSDNDIENDCNDDNSNNCENETIDLNNDRDCLELAMKTNDQPTTFQLRKPTAASVQAFSKHDTATKQSGECKNLHVNEKSSSTSYISYIACRRNSSDPKRKASIGNDQHQDLLCIRDDENYSKDCNQDLVLHNKATGFFVKCNVVTAVSTAALQSSAVSSMNPNSTSSVARIGDIENSSAAAAPKKVDNEDNGIQWKAVSEFETKPRQLDSKTSLPILISKCTQPSMTPSLCNNLPDAITSISESIYSNNGFTDCNQKVASFKIDVADKCKLPVSSAKSENAGNTLSSDKCSTDIATNSPDQKNIFDLKQSLEQRIAKSKTRSAKNDIVKSTTNTNLSRQAEIIELGTSEDEENEDEENETTLSSCWWRKKDSRKFETLTDADTTSDTMSSSCSQIKNDGQRTRLHERLEDIELNVIKNISGRKVLPKRIKLEDFYVPQESCKHTASGNTIKRTTANGYSHDANNQTNKTTMRKLQELQQCTSSSHEHSSMNQFPPENKTFDNSNILQCLLPVDRQGSCKDYVTKNKNTPTNCKYSFRECKRLKHPIQCISLSNINPVCQNQNFATHCHTVWLASCGDNCVEIFELSLAGPEIGSGQYSSSTCTTSSCNNNNSTHTRIQQSVLKPVFFFKDKNPKESYNVCVFSDSTMKNYKKELLTNDDCTRSYQQLLCVAGLSGIIQIFSLGTKSLCHSLAGHSSEVLDLKVCPVYMSITVLVSSSKDETLRLWNIETGECLAILGGHLGHRGPVICTSWHCDGQRILSGGADHSIKIWNVQEIIATFSKITYSARTLPTMHGKQSAEVVQPAFSECTRYTSSREQIERTAQEKRKNQLQSVHTSSSVIAVGKKLSQCVRLQFPVFSTDKAHCGFVDCVQFWGDLVLSKSHDEQIVLWKPIMEPKQTRLGSASYPPSSNLVALWTFFIPDANVWYIRFATTLGIKDDNKEAVGNNALAVGNSKGEVFLWDVSNPTKKYHKLSSSDLHLPSTKIQSLAFCPENKLIVSGQDGTICVIDIEAKSQSSPLSANNIQFDMKNKAVANGKTSGMLSKF